MTNSFTCSYSYYSLSVAIELFAGSYPSHKIPMGLRSFDALIAQLSPLYHFEYDKDDIENAEYAKILNSSDIGLVKKAWILMSDAQ